MSSSPDEIRALMRGPSCDECGGPLGSPAGRPSETYACLNPDCERGPRLPGLPEALEAVTAALEACLAHANVSNPFHATMTPEDYRTRSEAVATARAVLRTPRPVNRLVITVEGGNITSLDADRPTGLRVFVVDFDTEESEGERIYTVEGETAYAYEKQPDGMVPSAERWIEPIEKRENQGPEEQPIPESKSESDHLRDAGRGHLAR